MAKRAKARRKRKKLSLKQIEELRSARLKEIASLEKQRDKFKAKIEEIGDRLAALRGHKRRGRPAAEAAPVKKVRRRRRAKNKMPLREVLIAALKDAGRAMKTAELVEAVSNSGYKTRSKNPRTVVYQAIHKAEEIVPAKNGSGYILKNGRSK